MTHQPAFNPKRFSISLAIPLIIGSIGGAVTAPAIPTWYLSLYKPIFAPPNWLFGPVWTILYLFMGVSLYALWQGRVGEERRQAITFFAVQLIANLLWSILFFGFRSPMLAFIDIIFLDLTIFISIKSSQKVSRIAAFLLIPYLCWTVFATLLNYSIVILN